jgi:hypothetical protein
MSDRPRHLGGTHGRQRAVAWRSRGPAPRQRSGLVSRSVAFSSGSDPCIKASALALLVYVEGPMTTGRAVRHCYVASSRCSAEYLLSRLKLSGVRSGGLGDS